MKKKEGSDFDLRFFFFFFLFFFLKRLKVWVIVRTKGMITEGVTHREALVLAV